MATPPVFSAGAVLTAAQMNQIGLWKTVPTVSGTGATVSTNGTVTISNGTTTGCFLDNCFTDDFRNYKVLITNLTGSTTGYVFFRMSVGGTANSTASSYIRNQAFATTGSLTNSTETTNLYYIGPATTTASLNGWVEFFQPKIAASTIFNVHITEDDGEVRIGGGRHTQATAYDGLFFASSAGTFSCTVQVYGYTQ